jgi:predicted nucleic acid-binding protein
VILEAVIRIGQIEVLAALFGSVVVPTSVAEEMSHPLTPALVREWMAQPPAWFTVQAPTSPAYPAGLRHRGERDAIALALEIQAGLILLDEEKPRAQAKALGLAVVGTVGILQRAADQGLIADLKAVYDALRKTDFRVSDRILADSLARHIASRQA